MLESFKFFSKLLYNNDDVKVGVDEYLGYVIFINNLENNSLQSERILNVLQYSFAISTIRPIRY